MKLIRFFAILCFTALLLSIPVSALAVTIRRVDGEIWVGEKRYTATVPDNVRVIEDETFYGDASLDTFFVPSYVHTIGSRAFAYSGLKAIYLPSTIVDIADDAFLGCSGLTIDLANEWSYAALWASRRGYADSPLADLLPTDFTWSCETSLTGASYGAPMTFIVQTGTDVQTVVLGFRPNSGAFTAITNQYSESICVDQGGVRTWKIEFTPSKVGMPASAGRMGVMVTTMSRNDEDWNFNPSWVDITDDYSFS